MTPLALMRDAFAAEGVRITNTKMLANVATRYWLRQAGLAELRATACLEALSHVTDRHARDSARVELAQAALDVGVALDHAEYFARVHAKLADRLANKVAAATRPA